VYAQQGYSNYEIIIVDDGSVDDTKTIAATFQDIKYIYQPNAGLSAARNTGIKNCTGKYLIFLDADDWLLPEAMTINAKYLIGHDEIAFVSGAHKYFLEQENRFIDMQKEVTENHYSAFLESNYISMHATVLYQRWVFDNMQYDVSLKACEDYDLFLRVARKFPVLHHTRFIAVYRIHNTNMSGNIVLMINSVLHVLKQQQKHLRNDSEKASYEKGIIYMQSYYSEELYEKILMQLPEKKPTKTELKILKQYNKNLYVIIRKKQQKKKVADYKKKVPSFLKHIYFGARKILGK